MKEWCIAITFMRQKKEKMPARRVVELITAINFKSHIWQNNFEIDPNTLDSSIKRWKRTAETAPASYDLHRWMTNGMHSQLNTIFFISAHSCTQFFTWSMNGRKKGTDVYSPMAPKWTQNVAFSIM
jgi:hypothetical protein